MARDLYGVMGDPVDGSLSPEVVGAALGLLGRAAAYVPFAVPADKLAAAFDAARVLRLKGFNVTLPHKERAAALCDALEGDAAAIGAVNVVAAVGGRLVGHNTDATAIAQALAKARTDVRGERALVLGAGGAARAAAFALGRAGASEVVVANRTFARARALAASLAKSGVAALASPLSAAAVRELLPISRVVVNATSVGTNAPEDSPVPAEAPLEPGTLAIDLVYRPLKTRFLQQAREQGATVVDGLDVLVLQAIASLSIWLGKPLDRARLAAPMRTAALEALV